MAAGIPAPTLPGQAAFAPAKPGVFVALVHKTRLPSCRRQGPVPPGGSTFPASAPTKGITHYTLHAKLCATKPPVSLDSSCITGAEPLGCCQNKFLL